MIWQWRVLEWAVDTFGPIAKDRVERATRFAEEATELAQACGVSEARMRAVVERVYRRPAGKIPTEVAQAGMTLACLAANEGIELENAVGFELFNVKEKPREHWRARQGEKAAQGIGDVPT